MWTVFLYFVAAALFLAGHRVAGATVLFVAAVGTVVQAFLPDEEDEDEETLEKS